LQRLNINFLAISQQKSRVKCECKKNDAKIDTDKRY